MIGKRENIRFHQHIDDSTAHISWWPARYKSRTYFQARLSLTLEIFGYNSASQCTCGKISKKLFIRIRKIFQLFYIKLFHRLAGPCLCSRLCHHTLHLLGKERKGKYVFSYLQTHCREQGSFGSSLQDVALMSYMCCKPHCKWSNSLGEITLVISTGGNTHMLGHKCFRLGKF